MGSATTISSSSFTVPRAKRPDKAQDEPVCVFILQCSSRDNYVQINIEQSTFNHMITRRQRRRWWNKNEMRPENLQTDRRQLSHVHITSRNYAPPSHLWADWRTRKTAESTAVN